jgi:hypothetical protein
MPMRELVGERVKGCENVDGEIQGDTTKTTSSRRVCTCMEVGVPLSLSHACALADLPVAVDCSL